MIYKGRCHCGAVIAEFETQTVPKLRQDGCGFCASRGVKSASDPIGALRIAASASLTRYRFGHKTADFLICSVCGTYVAAIMEGPNGPVGVINVVGLSVPELMNESAMLANLDGETHEARRARRLSRWTPLTLIEWRP